MTDLKSDSLKESVSPCFWLVTTIQDGTYEGECDVDFVGAKVKVTVADGAITKVELVKHKNEKGAPAEKVVENALKNATKK